MHLCDPSHHSQESRGLQLWARKNSPKIFPYLPAHIFKELPKKVENSPTLRKTGEHWTGRPRTSRGSEKIAQRQAKKGFRLCFGCFSATFRLTFWLFIRGSKFLACPMSCLLHPSPLYFSKSAATRRYKWAVGAPLYSPVRKRVCVCVCARALSCFYGSSLPAMAVSSTFAR